MNTPAGVYPLPRYGAGMTVTILQQLYPDNNSVIDYQLYHTPLFNFDKATLQEVTLQVGLAFSVSKIENLRINPVKRPPSFLIIYGNRLFLLLENIADEEGNDIIL